MNHIKSVLDVTKLISHSTEMLKLIVENKKATCFVAILRKNSVCKLAEGQSVLKAETGF